MQPIEYLLTYKGYNRGWNCRVSGKVGCGWGSRPELAIRDWKAQYKRLALGTVVYDSKALTVSVKGA